MRPCLTFPIPRSVSSRLPSTSTSPTGRSPISSATRELSRRSSSGSSSRPGTATRRQSAPAQISCTVAQAVVAAGGFAEVPIGEDVHSGVKLWRAGYETRYLPLCLATGVAPTDFASLANQQARWCRSSMLLMVDKHFLEAPFTWQQRAAFWAAFLYYMSSAALLITGPFPTVTMIWFFPQRIYPQNYLPILPALAASVFVFPMLSRGWRPTIYRICMINSCCHLYSVWYAVRGRVAEWVPTGASPSSGQVPVTVNRILCSLDSARASAHLVRPRAARARVRLASVLGDRGPRWRPALHAGAFANCGQGCLGPQTSEARGGNGRGGSGVRGNGTTRHQGGTRVASPPRPQRTRSELMRHRSTRSQRKPRQRVKLVAAIIGAAAIAAAVTLYNKSADPSGPLPVHLPVTPDSYLGVFVEAPGFLRWRERVRAGNRNETRYGYVLQRMVRPIPGKIRRDCCQEWRRAACADGSGWHQRRQDRCRSYDGYLAHYAESRSYVSGPGDPQLRPRDEWQLVLVGLHSTRRLRCSLLPGGTLSRLFRALGASNVTWLWTVNIINDTQHGRIPGPAPWWPGGKYVNWVGIDGYYFKRAWEFAPLFGPTLAAVHELTSDPILIAETGAVPASGAAFEDRQSVRWYSRVRLAGIRMV